MFAQAGGKAALHKVVRALSAVDVRVGAIADIDLLADGALLRRIVESLGGVWDDVEELQRLVDADVRSTERKAYRDYVAQEIGKALTAPPGSRISTAEAKAIRASVKTDGDWKEVRRSGLIHLRGETHARAVELIDRLRALRLFVVPSGELESFGPEISVHGSEWVSAALAADVHRRSPSVEFVKAVHGRF